MDPAERALLAGLGMDGALKQMDTNPALGTALHVALVSSGLAHGAITKPVATFLFSVASGLPENRAARRDLVAHYIGTGKLVTASQVNAALDYLKKASPEGDVKIAEFEAACGAGVVITDDELRAKVCAGREAWC